MTLDGLRRPGAASAEVLHRRPGAGAKGGVPADVELISNAISAPATPRVFPAGDVSGVPLNPRSSVSAYRPVATSSRSPLTCASLVVVTLTPSPPRATAMASVPRALVDDDTREALKLVIDVQTRKVGRARRAVR